MSTDHNEFYTLFKLNENEKKQLLYKYIRIKPMICACDDFILILKPTGKVDFVGEEQREAGGIFGD